MNNNNWSIYTSLIKCVYTQVLDCCTCTTRLSIQPHARLCTHKSHRLWRV